MRYRLAVFRHPTSGVIHLALELQGAKLRRVGAVDRYSLCGRLLSAAPRGPDEDPPESPTMDFEGFTTLKRLERAGERVCSTCARSPSARLVGQIREGGAVGALGIAEASLVDLSAAISLAQRETPGTPFDSPALASALIALRDLANLHLERGRALE